MDNILWYTINNGTSFVRYGDPQAFVPAGGGTASQASAGVGGPVSLSIEGATGYADDGFVIPLGSLGSFKGYTVQGTGDPFGANLWFDIGGTGQYFTWNGNTYVQASPGAYGIGPGSSGGTISVGASSSFGMTGSAAGCPSGTYEVTLSKLQSGYCSGISAKTPVALWVGINTPSSGGSLSVTITSVALS